MESVKIGRCTSNDGPRLTMCLPDLSARLMTQVSGSLMIVRRWVRFGTSRCSSTRPVLCSGAPEGPGLCRERAGDGPGFQPARRRPEHGLRNVLALGQTASRQIPRRPAAKRALDGWHSTESLIELNPQPATADCRHAVTGKNPAGTIIQSIVLYIGGVT